MQSHSLFGKGKLPELLQTEASECGLTCLAMIASYHGHNVKLSELRHRHNVTLKGLTLTRVCEIAEAMKLMPRALRLDLEELPQLALPAVLHWDMSHFVVLRSVDGQTATIHDPAAGQLRMPLRELSRHFTGVALELSPSIDFTRRRKPPALRIRDVVGPVSGFKRSLFQFFLLALGLELLAVLSPMLFQWTTDEATTQGDPRLLGTLCFGAIGIAFVTSVLGGMRAWVGLHITTHFNLQWLSNVMSHLLSLPVSYFERRHLGDIVSRFGSVANITHALTASAVEALLDGFLAVGTLVMMLIYSPVMALVALGGTLLYAGIRWARYGTLKLASTNSLTRQAKEQSYFLETIRGVRSIKLFNKERDRKNAWVGLWIDSVNSSNIVQKINLVFSSWWGLISSIERICILWYGAKLVIDHDLTIGMLFASLTYKEQFGARANALIDKLVDLKMLSISVERLADIVTATPESGNHTNSLDAPLDQFTLKLEGLRFRYSSDEPWIVNNANLSIADGECIAIVGPSGAGKTTLFKLMLGLLQPGAGTVRVGGRSLAQLGLRRYRSHIGTVMQDDQLFAGTVLENITFMSAKPDLEHVSACCVIARINTEILAMPMGFHTLVGDMGTVLSGGQKQRILLARALYQRPRILFLDEATSHLDIESERAIGDAVRQLRITRVMIAHRKETIAIADRILSFEGGKLVAVDRDEFLAQAAMPASPTLSSS